MDAMPARESKRYSLWVILTVLMASLGFAMIIVGFALWSVQFSVFFVLGAITTAVTFVKMDRDRWTAVGFLVGIFILSLVLYPYLHSHVG